MCLVLRVGEGGGRSHVLRGGFGNRAGPPGLWGVLIFLSENNVVLGERHHSQCSRKPRAESSASWSALAPMHCTVDMQFQGETRLTLYMKTGQWQ